MTENELRLMAATAIQEVNSMHADPDVGAALARAASASPPRCLRERIVGRPSGRSIFRTTSGQVMVAMTCMRAPHRGHGTG